MGIHCIVFDFDGTLIDSNQLKYDAYFELFPADNRHTRIIREVLSERFEQTRYIILKEILRRLGVGERAHLNQEVSKLAERYNDIVLTGAKTCPEKAGAEEALNRLAPSFTLYLSSTTPEASLKEIIRFRKWDGYFRAVFGYPHEKSETLQHVMVLENLQPDQVLVVGDGDTDRESARESGCPFLHVPPNFSFDQIGAMLATYETNDTLL